MALFKFRKEPLGLLVWGKIVAIAGKYPRIFDFPGVGNFGSGTLALERLISVEIDHKTAALMLYALQTASMNLKRTSLEPQLPTQVLIDRDSVANRRLAPRPGQESRDVSTTI